MQIKRSVQKNIILPGKQIQTVNHWYFKCKAVGKTWLLKHFGAAEFENVAYFNLRTA